MAKAHNDPMQSVNETIEAFFSTNQDEHEKYTIYLDKQNLKEDVKFIKSAFHNVPGIVSIDVDTENACVKITSKNSEEAYTDLFKKYGYSVIATDHEEARHV